MIVYPVIASRGSLIMARTEKKPINRKRVHSLCFACALVAPSPCFAIDQPASPEDDSGLPIFHFDENRWLELTIPERGHPDTAAEIQEQINREKAYENAEEEGKSSLFDGDLKPLNEIRLRYKIRF